MSIFGHLVFSVIMSVIIFKINFLSGNDFIVNFIDDSALNISSTLLGFNLTIHAIIVGQISSIELAVKKIGHFKETREELKENAIFNIFLIILIFGLHLLKIKPGSSLSNFLGDFSKVINYWSDIAIIASMVLIIMLMVETIKAVYQISEFSFKKKS